MINRSLVTVSLSLSLFVPAVTTVTTLASADDAATAPSASNASATSECANAQFADHVDAGKPVGDASSIGAAKKAVYWVDVANPGAATQVTLVWMLDGQEVQRQLLDVGTSAHWHTWGIRPLGQAKVVQVKLLRADGSVMKEDALTLPGASSEPQKPAA